jgi:hypothetical protein
MFDWLRRPKPQDPKVTRAYEEGRQTAEHFSNDLDRLFQVRFGPVADGYLSVVQGQFNKSLDPTDAPPIVIARIEFDVFRENVTELRNKMTAEIEATLSDHLKIADMLDSRDKFVELIEAKVQAYCDKLTQDGLQRLIDMANALKLADGQWRVAHPELSAKFPPAN